jgi:hypothetical protein
MVARVSPKNRGSSKDLGKNRLFARETTLRWFVLPHKKKVRCKGHTKTVTLSVLKSTDTEQHFRKLALKLLLLLQQQLSLVLLL